MPQSDVFALHNSGLTPFLHAMVGSELNGSQLTILSMLARLGLDPWDEVAAWAKLPRNAASARLAQCIGRMPLSPQALAGASATATRLIPLLPSPTKVNVVPAGWAAVPAWVPVAVVLGVMALGFAVSTFATTQDPAPAPVAAPVTHRQG
jgi:hypothetical protein